MLLLTIICILLDLLAIYFIYVSDKNKMTSFIIKNFFVICFCITQTIWIIEMDKYPSSLETYQEQISQPDLYYPNCGTVIQKIEGFERHGKHHNEYYSEFLVIKFENYTDRIKVNRQTYSKYVVGSSICFAEETSYYPTHQIIILFGGIINVFGLIVIIMFIFKVNFDD